MRVVRPERPVPSEPLFADRFRNYIVSTNSTPRVCSVSGTTKNLMYQLGKVLLSAFLDTLLVHWSDTVT